MPQLQPFPKVADNTKHEDTGCAPVGPSCLACPLDDCLHDDPSALRRFKARQLIARIEGLSIPQAAKALGVHERSITRMRRRAGLVVSSRNHRHEKESDQLGDRTVNA